MNINEKDFEKIRPYHDWEINPALKRITEADVFADVARFVFPDKSVEEVKALVNSIHTASDFQVKFMHKAVRRVVETSSDGLTYEGFENLDPGKAYLFIANHRDIVLDSAILQALLVEHNIPTTEITFGSNLMNSPFIIDFGKVNKMFIVFRGGSKIEILHNARQLSNYIRFTITDKTNSAWIAQRNGRTKDGHDRTEEALLKMLNISGGGEVSRNFSELNIVPLTISYEYEPCGLFKVNELYQTLSAEYVKSPGEDFKSIITGFTQPKGRIHLCVGKCLNEELKYFDDSKGKNESINTLTKIIDRHIYHDYKLWKTNYIASDVLMGNSSPDNYSEEEKNDFLRYIDGQIDKLEGDKKVLREMFLKMYANPVFNKLQ